MRIRGRWLAAAAVLVVAATVAVVVVGTGDDAATSLPRLRSGPGIVRVHAESNSGGNGADPQPRPNVSVGSTKALVQLRTVEGSGRPSARLQISVGQSTTDGSSYAAQHGCACVAGQQLTVGTLHFRVLHVWQRSGTGSDAVDLQVTSAR